MVFAGCLFSFARPFVGLTLATSCDSNGFLWWSEGPYKSVTSDFSSLQPPAVSFTPTGSSFARNTPRAQVTQELRMPQNSTLGSVGMLRCDLLPALKSIRRALADIPDSPSDPERNQLLSIARAQLSLLTTLYVTSKSQ